MVTNFFLLKSHPETFSWLSLYLETLVSSECLKKFFFLKHEEFSPLAVMGRINREGHFSLTDNHHYGKGPNTYDKLFAVCYTRQRDVGKEFFRKLILKIENKKDLIRGGHHRLATRPLCRNQKSRHFSRTTRPAEFGPTTFSSHVYTSFLSPHIILSRM